MITVVMSSEGESRGRPEMTKQEWEKRKLERGVVGGARGGEEEECAFVGGDRKKEA